MSGKQGGVKLREHVLGVEGVCRRRDVQANSVKTRGLEGRGVQAEVQAKGGAREGGVHAG